MGSLVGFYSLLVIATYVLLYVSGRCPDGYISASIGGPERIVDCPAVNGRPGSLISCPMNSTCFSDSSSTVRECCVLAGRVNVDSSECPNGMQLFADLQGRAITCIPGAQSSCPREYSCVQRSNINGRQGQNLYVCCMNRQPIQNFQCPLNRSLLTLGSSGNGIPRCSRVGDQCAENRDYTCMRSIVNSTDLICCSATNRPAEQQVTTSTYLVTPPAASRTLCVNTTLRYITNVCPRPGEKPILQSMHQYPLTCSEDKHCYKEPGVTCQFSPALGWNICCGPLPNITPIRCSNYRIAKMERGAPIVCNTSLDYCGLDWDCGTYNRRTEYCCASEQQVTPTCPNKTPALLRPKACTQNYPNACPEGYTCERTSDGSSRCCMIECVTQQSENRLIGNECGTGVSPVLDARGNTIACRNSQGGNSCPSGSSCNNRNNEQGVCCPGAGERQSTSYTCVLGRPLLDSGRNRDCSGCFNLNCCPHGYYCLPTKENSSVLVCCGA